jgi:hypothetical protein
MIALNDDVPVCKEHGLKIMRCDECCRVLDKFARSMPRVTPAPWREQFEPASAYVERLDRAEEENRDRLHSWAVANVYASEELPF